MKKIVKTLCLFLSVLLLFSVTAFAESSVIDDNQETDTFVFMRFDSDDVSYATYRKSDLHNSNMSTVSFGNSGSLDHAPCISPFSVIGTDGRTLVEDTTLFPYSAICWIVTTWQNGKSSLGTGWFFNEDSIMTAAHCVYDSSLGGIAKSVKVYPAKNGSLNPFGYVKATGCVINSNWEEYASTIHDYALVKLPSDIGSECGYFGYTCNGGTIGDNITVTGYPGDKMLDENGNQVEGNVRQWTMSGRLNAVTLHRLSYTIDTYGGQSGSPVYLTDSNIAIGIHTGSTALENHATRIDENIYQLMQNF